MKQIFKNFANFTENYLCWCLFLTKLGCNFIKKRLQHTCSPVKFAKFLRTLILKKICEQLLLNIFFQKHNTKVNTSMVTIDLSFINLYNLQKPCLLLIPLTVIKYLWFVTCCFQGIPKFKKNYNIHRKIYP